jgi:hypothetical protein
MDRLEERLKIAAKAYTTLTWITRSNDRAP